MHYVDLGERFPTNIHLQNLASIPKHLLKFAASASHQGNSSVFSNFLEPQSSIFKFQISNSQFPNFQLYPNPLPFFNFSDPSDLLRSLTIGSDRSDSFRSLRSFRSVPIIPSIRPDTSESCDLLHTHTASICPFSSFAC